MNKNSARLFISAALLVCGFVFTNSGINAQSGEKITAGSAGPIKIGMSVSEIRSALPKMTFKAISDGDGVPLIAVSEGENLHFTLYAGQDETGSQMDGNRIVEQIEVWSPLYKTQDGVGPGTLISDAEKKYGLVKEIMLSEIESRQYVEFVNGPKDIGFRIDYSGVFSVDQRTTTKYEKEGKILSIIIQGDGSETNVGFYSDYTDFETECKTPDGQGEDGGHVSTYCEGPDKFRVHMFDTALGLEILVESSESGESISVTRESLEFSTKGKKLEWRYKNGVPFAVILRGNTYKTGEDGLIKYPSEVSGEYLLVRGLPGFESINADVNVRTMRNANEEARKIADEGYVSVKFPRSKEFEALDTSDMNLMIVTANSKGEGWVKSAMEGAVRITGEFDEMRSRKMYFEAPTGEGADSFTLTVVDDGLLDDSVKSEKRVFEMVRESNGVWKVSSVKKSHACRPGRGHEDFSAAPCM